MNIFKTFTLKWWQAGCFKLGMLALGISIGAYWHDVFGGYPYFPDCGPVTFAYITYAWWEQ